MNNLNLERSSSVGRWMGYAIVVGMCIWLLYPWIEKPQLDAYHIKLIFGCVLFVLLAEEIKKELKKYKNDKN